MLSEIIWFYLSCNALLTVAAYSYDKVFNFQEKKYYLFKIMLFGVLILFKDLIPTKTKLKGVESV